MSSGFPGGGQPNMQELMKQAQMMQQQLAAAQAELAAATVVGTAGGGLVKATLTGDGELTSLEIDPQAVDPADVETLQDLVVAAVRDAHRAVGELAAEKMGPVTGGLGAGLGRRPGVGPKSAQRIAFHLLATEPADVERLASTLLRVKNEVKFCTVCGNVSQADVCRICSDPRRDLTVVCVVEEPKDVVAIERTREFRGRYHILGGAISPIDGIGPEDLRIRELLGRLRDGVVTELIIATDPNLEGEATATYLARLLMPMGLNVTRLASGLPVGGDLEYADEVTLGRAFAGRRRIE